VPSGASTGTTSCSTCCPGSTPRTRWRSTMP
jgi:hypothetical protein